MASIIHFGTLQRTTGNFEGFSGTWGPNHTPAPCAARDERISQPLELGPNE
jgi:hypothetical protein